MEKVIDIRPVKRQMRASTKEKRLSMMPKSNPLPIKKFVISCLICGL